MCSLFAMIQLVARYHRQQRGTHDNTIPYDATRGLFPLTKDHSKYRDLKTFVAERRYILNKRQDVIHSKALSHMEAWIRADPSKPYPREHWQSYTFMMALGTGERSTLFEQVSFTCLVVDQYYNVILIILMSFR